MARGLPFLAHGRAEIHFTVAVFRCDASDQSLYVIRILGRFRDLGRAPERGALTRLSYFCSHPMRSRHCQPVDTIPWPPLRNRARR